MLYEYRPYARYDLATLRDMHDAAYAKVCELEGQLCELEEGIEKAKAAGMDDVVKALESVKEDVEYELEKSSEREHEIFLELN